MEQDKIKQLKQRIEKTKDLLTPKAPYEFQKMPKKTTRTRAPKGYQHRCQSANDPTLRTKTLPAYVTAAHLSLSGDHLLILNHIRTALFQLQEQQTGHASFFELVLSHAVVFLYGYDSAVVQEFLALLCNKYAKIFPKIHASMQASFLQDKQL